MRGGLLVLASFAVGCAAAPRPRIAIPERCVCAETPSDAASAASSDEPRPPSAAELNLMYRAKAIAEATAKTDYWLENVGVVTAGELFLGRVEAPVLENEAGLAAVLPEQDLLRGMHDLRDLLGRDDAMPVAERNVVIWTAFDTEVAQFRESVAIALSERLAELLTRRAAIADLIGNVAEYVPAEFAPSASLRRDFAERRAHVMLATMAFPTARTLADEFIGKRKGQWLAALKGKL